VLICFIGETHHGIGMHENTILMADTIAELHWNFFESLIVMVGISLVKISIAFFLLRLVTKGYRIFIICMIGEFFSNFPKNKIGKSKIPLRRSIIYAGFRG
jgi:hypothetical protein